MVEERRTGKALVEHWPWAAEKGLVPKAAARTMAVSCRQVLEVEQDWGKVDVVTLDIGEFVQRFKTLRATDYKPRSLEDYAGRFRRGVKSYRDFLTDPSKWHYGSRARVGTSKPKTPQRRGGGAVPSADQRETVLQEYVYPFRKDVLVTLTIPQDATAAEIRRLVAWAQTLAVDYEGK